MLGVVAALPQEARCLAGVRLTPGALHRVGETLIRCCGPGEARAQRAAESLIEQGVRALVSWGTAGALEPTLRPGDLVLADTVLTEQGGLAVDPGWQRRLSRLIENRVSLSTGKLLQSARPVARTQDKRALFAAKGAIAVDMESGGVALAAQTRGLPFLTVRAIVDPQSRSLPGAALAALDEDGKTRPSRMLPVLLQDPVQIAGLLRLALDFRAALASLKRVTQFAGVRLALD